MQRITVLPSVLLLLVPAVPAQACEPVTRVAARVETPSLHDDEVGGNADADDPAIWVHATDGHRTRVVATAKNGGLRVYDLAGREVQAFATPPGPGPGDKPGRFNNVDLVGDLAVVSDRGRDRLRFYRIDPRTARLTDVTAPDAPPVFSADQAEVNKQRTAYGLGAWRDRTGTYALVSRRGTPELGIFEI